MPIIGYGTKNIGNLRLWQAESADDFDFAAFDSGDYDGAVKSQNDAENISKVLYPNDNTDKGKVLRLKQEYFFSAASVTDALRKHKARFGTFDNLADYVTIQLNDTHPVIAIPELIRQLIAEGYTFDKAFDIAHKVFNYTNHTIMAEALEKWDSKTVEKVLPDVYAVILQINEKFYADMYARGMDKAQIRDMAPVGDDKVKMAFMAIFVSSYVNGVAAIHTEILKNDALKEWYEIYPERFQNKTNGITQRRWLALCNPELSSLITKLLGNANWVKDLDELKKLEKFADDENVLKEFMVIKEAKKHQLAEFVKAHDGKDIDTSWIFDIQIKRLHEYKRQFLNVLSILYIYFGIKDGSIKDFTPTVFIFGAKSAPGYRRAKAIIKLINEIGDFVNADPETADKLKVVFVQNYNVSYAEKLVCAADVSEQISTAGTEASGTGNMKLMLNGAVTLGTYDGANVEIVEEAGEENNYIFGARVEELAEIMPEYDPREILFKDEKIKRVLDKLIDGTFSDGGVPSDQEGSFRELYKALTDGASWHVPDHYYVLGDINSYVETKLRLNADYKDSLAFAKKCWLNICNAGKFSSDRTIKDYAENIWKI
jgi:starch phosphorylase